jgi:hypothetical protein
VLKKPINHLLMNQNKDEAALSRKSNEKIHALLEMNGNKNIPLEFL